VRWNICQNGEIGGTFKEKFVGENSEIDKAFAVKNTNQHRISASQSLLRRQKIVYLS
jgi:hypothetical protein